MPAPELVVFDLDGTLVDTLRSICEATNGVLRDEGLPTHPIESYRRFAGDGAAMLIHRATDHQFRDDPDAIDRLIARFRERDEKTDAQYAKPYDGVPDMLDALASAGVQLAVLSNKEHAEAVAVVERWFGLDRFVEVAGHGVGYPLKPDPTGLLTIAQRFRATPARLAFVGDTDTDMRTGRNAQAFTVGCLWGFRDEPELRAAGADAIAASPSDLTPLLLSHA
ncbi:MAG: HAD family hydrolase [Phycisphaerales bacterium]|nr:MAG: HAD family hydrolase [Phycisphaerales bacterium]